MAVLAVATLAISSPLFAATQAGTAASVEGDVKVMKPTDSTPHVLKTGDPVFMGDKIETGSNGRLQVKLLDETEFILGASSAMAIDEFVYDPATKDGKVKTSMLKGIFRIISGEIAHKNNENMVVNLPAGTMGFRGTEVVGIINGARTEIMLIGPVGVGRISVTNLVNGEVVTVDIDEAGFGTIVNGPNSAPIAVFQVTPAQLAAAAQQLGLPPFNLAGLPDVDTLDTQVQSEESSRDISSTTA